VNGPRRPTLNDLLKRAGLGRSGLPLTDTRSYLQARLDERPWQDRPGADPFQGLQNAPEGFDFTGKKGAYGAHASFLAPTEEDTRTWGNSQAICFDVKSFYLREQVSTQLVHVARRRPTTFTIKTILTFQQGWAGEGPWNLVLSYTLGVGQTQDTITKTIAIPAPAVGLQVVDTDTLPANAIQAKGALVGAPTVLGRHSALLSQFAAPVYA
jgi:hypothetical protein